MSTQQVCEHANPTRTPAHGRSSDATPPTQFGGHEHRPNTQQTLNRVCVCVRARTPYVQPSARIAAHLPARARLLILVTRFRRRRSLVLVLSQRGDHRCDLL